MPEKYRVTIVQQMYGQQFQNVLHFTGPVSDPLQMSALADEIAAQWVTQVRFLHTSALTYNAIKVRWLESQFPPFTKVINIAGANGFDNELFPQVAYVVRLRTDFVGRKGRGRFYVGGVMKGHVVNGFITSDQNTAINVRLANLMAVFGPTGSSTFDLHISNSKAPFDFKQVTSMSLAPTTGTQRRRNIGIGV